MKMSRRRLMEWMGVSGGAVLGAPLLEANKALADTGFAALFDTAQEKSQVDFSADTRWAKSAQRKREQTSDITWLTHEPVVYWLRHGGHGDDEFARYERMLQPNNFKRMAEAGVQFGRIFFYKGFGLAYERPHIEQARRAAEQMHQLGMKVSLYVAGTMFTEALYREVPEARTWEERDCWGHWIPYGIQTFRHFPCHNQPGYREYMKRVLRVGIQELHADELAFDQISLQPEPRSCRCERCLQLFTAFLRKHYPTSNDALHRFGLPEVDWIRMNEWDANGSSDEGPTELAVINDPVLQEWIRFRCECLADWAAFLSSYAKSLNPHVAISFNMKGIYSFNRCWTYAVYHPLFAGHVDRFSFDTGGYTAGIDPETGALISQIRSYKVARRIRSSSEESDFLDDEIRLAAFMAFGYQKPVCTAAPWGPGAFNVFTSFMEFFREYNDRYFIETEIVSDVAVLRNWPSMAYSVSATSIPVTLMEQILIQYKVPFDLLFDEQLDQIGRFRAVILAGQECISNEQAALFVRYVEAGGVLIVSGSAGKYNERREERSKSPLPPPGWLGKGRVVVTPEIIRGDLHTEEKVAGDQNPEPNITLRRGAQLSPSQWVLPKNHEVIHQAIQAAISEDFSIVTEAPLTTVMELTTREKSREIIVHFINFDRRHSTAAFFVKLRRQFSSPVKSVTCLNPDVDQPLNLEFEEKSDLIRFKAPATRAYTMIVVTHSI
jgi:hypothetical protein